MWAILRRDLLAAARYRAGFAIAVLGALAEMAAFYFLARAVGPAFRPDGVGYYPFLLVGTGLYAFLIMGINAFLGTVQEAQQNGTLEVLMTTATPPTTLVFLSALSSFAGKTITLLFYVLGGLLLFRVPLPKPNIPGCVVIFVLSLGIAASIGVVAAALQLAIQKGSAVVWLLGSGVWFLTGTMFPVSALPPVLRGLSALIPLTHALDGMRLALLEGAPFSILDREITILATFCVIMLPFSLLVFSYTLRQARRNGTLSFY
jgi:ABC-2 type transport system permease protein